MTLPILVGVDGRQKMSKSLGNQIGITDAPQEMYGKTLSIPDEAMADYYRLLLHVQAPAECSPRDAKRRLARELVGWLHSPEQALAAERHFDRVFVEGEAPEQIEEAGFQAGEGGMVHLPEVMAQAFGMSRSEARRLIEQGGVSLDEVALGAGEYDVAAERAEGAVLKVGKRRFRRLRALGS
jgi:tyrosyl-tRNA synthetase